ncbi:MAG: hypothetical protein A3K68_05170 [Euryarchaeota archaeon RBG_16_68_13]|nr:MAG: hypothetical protein A3K68_05170 [Euryarchaeota archaeon RBG_16_68_13]
MGMRAVGALAILLFVASVPPAVPDAITLRPSGEGALVSPLSAPSPSGTLGVAPGYDDASEFFMGDVAVGVFLVESAGFAYDWSDAEANQTLNGIYAGMDWWVGQDARARLSFEYELHVRTPTAWEPIQNSLDDDWQWIDEIMAGLGYTEPDAWSKTHHFNIDLRSRLGTDWALSLFVADSEGTVNQGLFTNGQYAHAYYGGPWITMSRYSSWAYNSADYFRAVPAHEIGHIFYATDEYDTGPVEYAGYLNCPDSNGATGIMNRNTLSISTSTRCQIGWVDSDADGIFDILDVPPETAILSIAPDPTNETKIRVTGSATVVPLTNRNPYGPRNDVTISEITEAEFRVNSGSWANATPSDGAFDEPEESFAFVVPAILASTVDPLPAYRRGGIFNLTVQSSPEAAPRTVKTRAGNTEGNVDETPTQDEIPPAGEEPSSVELWYAREGSVFAWIGTDASPPWAWSFDPAAAGGDGLYRFYSVAVDAVGTREPAPVSEDASTTVDTRPPSLTLVGPADADWIASRTVDVTWVATDDGSGAANGSVSLDDGPVEDVGTATSHRLSDLTEGWHRVQIVSRDRAGNDVNASVTFGVDVTGPVLVLVSPDLTREITENRIALAWNVSDALSDVEQVELRLDVGSPIRTTGTAYVFDGVGDGDHTVILIAVDRAGNERTLTVSFTIHADWITGGGAYGWLPMVSLIAALAAGGLAVALWRRKRRPV